MNCAKCGEVCSCPRSSSSVPPDPETEAIPDTGPSLDASAWRGELSDRLNRYRSRRKAPPPRYPSLRLPFGRPEVAPRTTARPEIPAAPAFEPVSNHALALDHSQPGISAHLEDPVTSSPDPDPAVRVRTHVPQPTAKIIEFPRFAWAPPAPPPDQLAEPVFDRPRILEVPEVEPPPPALGGIMIEPVAKLDPEKRPGIDVPLQTAPLGSRIIAAAIDTVIVAAGSALFGYIFWKIAAIRPPQIQLLGMMAGGLAIFWAAYQYLLIVHGGSTPGCRIAGLQLAKFDGSPAARSLRRWRVLASYLSAVSLGMGYAWVFLDEDSLCWHDRITHTYLAPRSRTKAEPSS